MENKKYLPLKIVHSILLAVSLALCLITLIKNPNDTTAFGTNPLAITCSVLNIIMLALSLVYMLMNYSKHAHIVYKCFFAALFIGTLIHNVYSASLAYSTYRTILRLILFASIVVLATAKDLGKTNTMLLTIFFVLCRLVLLIEYIINIPKFGTATFAVLSGGVANLLIAITAGVMVMGKYLDKAERGTK